MNNTECEMEGDGIQRLMLHCQHIFLFYLFLIILFSTVIWNLCFFCFFFFVRKVLVFVVVER